MQKTHLLCRGYFLGTICAKLESDIFFDEIISIQYVGEEHVYDLSIEGTHNFIANAIVAHNTFVTGFVNFTNNTAFNQTLYLVNGNVGIGTTSPGANLQIGTTGSPRLQFGGPTFYSDVSYQVSAGVMDFNVTTGNTAVNYYQFKNDGAAKVVISGTGNVGIGTTAPNYKLDVSGNISINGNAITTSATNKALTSGANTTILNITSGGSDTETIAVIIDYALLQNQAGALHAEYGSATLGFRADSSSESVIGKATKFGTASVNSPNIDFYGAQFGRSYIINASTTQGNNNNQLGYSVRVISILGRGNEVIRII